MQSRHYHMRFANDVVQSLLPVSLTQAKLSLIDLNLLVVFDAVMRERSVTRAGKRLSLSQPAMSHALARLRHMLKDDLFVRSPKGMVPTVRAEQLTIPISEALDGLLNSLEPAEFELSKSTRSFRIAVDVYSAIVLVEPLASRVKKAAPGVELHFRPSGTLDIPDLLDSGEIDLAIGLFEAPPERFAYEHLVQDRLVVVARKDHPAASKGKISPSDLVTWPHLLLTSAGPALEMATRVLARRKISFRVGLRAPLVSAEQCLVTSDMFAIMRACVAKVMTRGNRVDFFPLPFPSPAVRAGMIWHRRLSGDAAHAWLRDTTITTSQGLQRC
jgi:DNA-binding transcriptional LysR family regulator